MTTLVILTTGPAIADHRNQCVIQPGQPFEAPDWSALPAWDALAKAKAAGRIAPAPAPKVKPAKTKAAKAKPATTTAAKPAPTN